MIYGKEVPRVWTKPKKKLTPKNSLGFKFIEFCELLGVDLLPWQKWLAIHSLETITEGDHWRFSKLKKVGETTRPFRYDLNQIPYDYTVEVRNRFRG